MDKQTYQRGILVLSMSGLKIDEDSVEFFWQRLKKMDGVEFLEAIGKEDGNGVGLINDPKFKTWYGNENVPLLIMEKQKELKTERNKLRLKEKDKQRQLEWERDVADPPKNLNMPSFYAKHISQLNKKNVRQTK